MAIIMIPNKFHLRKVNRKLESDKWTDIGVAAAEMLTRKQIGKSLFDILIEHGVINTISGTESSKPVKTIEVLCDTAGGESTQVIQLDYGYVLTETGLALNRHFDIIEDSAATPEDAQQIMMEMVSRELFYGSIPFRGFLDSEYSPNLPVLHMAAPLIPRYPKNYYHWMIETAPKIKYIRRFEQKTGSNVCVIIPSDAPSFVDETLTLLNWPDSKIIETSEKVYKVNNLVIPPFPKKTEAEFNWLRDEIKNNTVIKENTSGISKRKNIYISRSDAVERRVVNEDEVMDVLKKYDFNKYNLEDRTVSANLHLFSNANIVIGPHGAGLTDIIFTDECSLVELFGNRVNKAYEKIANRLDINYEPMYCESDSVDIIVDTEELERRILQLVEHS